MHCVTPRREADGTFHVVGQSFAYRSSSTYSFKSSQ